jgi:hypothetical protein
MATISIFQEELAAVRQSYLGFYCERCKKGANPMACRGDLFCPDCLGYDLTPAATKS